MLAFFYSSSMSSSSLSRVTPVTRAFVVERWAELLSLPCEQRNKCASTPKISVKILRIYLWCAFCNPKPLVFVFLLHHFSARQCHHQVCVFAEQSVFGFCCCCWMAVGVAVMRNQKCMNRTSDRKHTVHAHQHASHQLDKNDNRHSWSFFSLAAYTFALSGEQSCKRPSTHSVHFYEIWHINSQVAVVAAIRPSWQSSGITFWSFVDVHNNNESWQHHFITIYITQTAMKTMAATHDQTNK